jgi:hypothetical protein
MNADKRTMEELLIEGEKLAEERRQEVEAEEVARLEKEKQEYKKIRDEVCQALPEVLSEFVTHCWRIHKNFRVVSFLEIENWAPIKIYFMTDSSGILYPARFEVLKYIDDGYEGEEPSFTVFEFPETLVEALLSAKNLGNNKSNILEIIKQRKQKVEVKALSLGDQIVNLIRMIMREEM